MGDETDGHSDGLAAWALATHIAAVDVFVHSIDDGYLSKEYGVECRQRSSTSSGTSLVLHAYSRKGQERGNKECPKRAEIKLVFAIGNATWKTNVHDMANRITAGKPSRPTAMFSSNAGA